MKRAIYTILILSIILSCSSDDRPEPEITVNIEQGLLGEWYVEWDCHRTHIWTFYNDGGFDINFMDEINNGSYSLNGTSLTLRGYNDIGEGEMKNEIMVLTPNRLELDNTADWGIDYKFVRSCN